MPPPRYPQPDEEDVGLRLPDPDRLLLRAADRADGAVELEPRRGDDVTAIDIAPELLEDVQREREARRWAADVAEVDVDVNRQLDPRVLADPDPDEGPSGICWIRDVRTVTRRGLPSRRIVRPTTWPGRRLATAARSSAGVRTGRPSTATITSCGSSTVAAGASGATPSTRTPRGTARTGKPASRSATAAATCSERFISARASWRRSANDEPGGTTACSAPSSTPPDAGTHQAFRPGRTPDDKVDVDPAPIRVVLLALDPHLRGECPASFRTYR